LRHGGTEWKARSFSLVEDGHEGFLGDVDGADGLHPLLALFLFVEEFAFAADVTVPRR